MLIDLRDGNWASEKHLHVVQVESLEHRKYNFQTFETFPAVLVERLIEAWYIRMYNSLSQLMLNKIGSQSIAVGVHRVLLHNRLIRSDVVEPPLDRHEY